MSENETEEAEKFLLGLFDFERARLAQKRLKPFTTERVKDALRYRGLEPESPRPIIHIAGTKGKGSVAWYLQWALSQNHKQVGLFSSPHLISLRERIRIGNQLIKIQSLRERAEALHRLNEEKFNGELTFFEFLFLIAMEEFAGANCPWMILETGMGGRLDATNAVRSRLSVLTRIDYDHTEFLGNTLGAIAGEKAGIVKEGGEVVALKQKEEVNRVFEEACLSKGARLHWVEPKREGADEENRAIAEKVLECLGEEVSDFEQVGLNLPGRFQQITSSGQSLLLDSAHNPLSLSVLSSHLEARSPKWQGAFAMAEGRDVRAMLESLLPVTEELTVFELPGGRPGMPAKDILAVWKSLGGTGILGLDLQEWLGLNSHLPKFLTGSFYLVGEALEKLGYGADDLWPQPI